MQSTAPRCAQRNGDHSLDTLHQWENKHELGGKGAAVKLSSIYNAARSHGTMDYRNHSRARQDSDPDLVLDGALEVSLPLKAKIWPRPQKGTNPKLPSVAVSKE